MKCPGCSFVCSDLRDVCPRCYVDFRPHKQSRGLRITNPKATYESLLAELKPKSSDIAPSTASDPQTSLFGTIKRVFARAEVQTEGLPIEPEIPEYKEPVPEKVLPLIPSELLEAALENANLLESSESEEKPAARTPGELYLDDDDDLEEFPTEILEVLTPGVIDEINLSLTEHDVDEEEEAPDEIDNLPGVAASLAAQVTTEKFVHTDGSAEISEPMLQAEQFEVRSTDFTEPTIKLIPILPLTPERLEVTDLFCEATLWLDKNFDDDSVELSLEQFSSFAGREDIELYFELAAEVIDDPQRTYETKIIESSERKVLAPALEEALARTQKVYAASLLSLREGLPKVQADLESAGLTSAVRVPKFKPAAWKRRLWAALVDRASVALLSIAAGLIIAWRTDSTITIDLLSLTSMTFSEAAFIGGWSVVVYLLLWPFFPLLCDLMFERTPGLMVTKLKIVRWDGRNAPVLAVAKRGILSGLGVIFGLSFPWWRSQGTSPIDVLSDTVVVGRGTL